MKKAFVLGIVTLMGVSAYAQDAVVPITSFENWEEAWAYSGNTITYSAIEELPTEVPQIDGPNALFVEYNNNGSSWQWAQLGFPQAVDISGMRELRMSVYWMPEITGTRRSIRVDLANGVGLGTQSVSESGKWVELSWPINRFTSPTLTAVSFWGGFISPDEADNAGSLYIDKVYAIRKDGTPAEFEEFTPYNFDSEEDGSFAPKGWRFDALQGDIGAGEVDASEGSNYFAIYLGSGWSNAIVTTDARSSFDRWPDVVDIQLDTRVGADYTGGWVQFGIALQSSGTGTVGTVTDWDDYPEQGFGEARDTWKTLIWQVDMSKHAGAFEGVEGSTFQLVLHVNNDSAAAGQTVYIDNLRVGVGKQSGTDVAAWELY